MVVPIEDVWEQGMSNQEESDDDSEPDPRVNELIQPAESPKAMSRQTSPDENPEPLVELNENLDILLETYNAGDTLVVRPAG